MAPSKKEAAILKLLRKAALLIFLIFIPHVGFYLLLPQDAFDSSYHAAVIDKIELLDNSPSPRIILVGGSMVAFGVDSETLQKRLGYSVVNFGTHVGYGLRLMLDLIEPKLLPGDIVIIVPEYNYFSDGVDGDGRMLSYLIKAYPPAFRYLRTRDQILSLIMYYPNMMQEMLEFIIEKPARSSIYFRGAFNRYGDLISHLDMPNWEFNYRPYVYTGIQTDPIIMDAVNLLNDFTDHALSNEVDVYVLFPAVIDEAYLSAEEDFYKLSQFLKNEVHTEFISEPGDSAFPLEFFFNTKYHLNRRGREKFTQLIIEKLEPIISNSGRR